MVSALWATPTKWGHQGAARTWIQCDCIIFCVRAAGCTSCSRREHQGSAKAARERTREEEKASKLDCCCVGMSHHLCCGRWINGHWRNTWHWCSPEVKGMLLQGEVPPRALPASAAREMEDPSDPGCCVLQAWGWQGLSRLHPTALFYVKAARKWGIWRALVAPWPSPFLPINLPHLSACEWRCLHSPLHFGQPLLARHGRSVPPALCNGHLRTCCPGVNTCTFAPPVPWNGESIWSTSGAPEAHLAHSPGETTGLPGMTQSQPAGEAMRCAGVKSPLLTLVTTTKSAFCFPLTGRVCQFVIKPYLTQLKFHKSSKPKVYGPLQRLQCLHML